MQVLDIIMAIGLPSAIFASIITICTKRITNKIDKSEKAREETDRERRHYEEFQVQMILAVTNLCEANAIALQNGRCNGETHKALEYLEEVRKEQQKFIINRGVENLF